MLPQLGDGATGPKGGASRLERGLSRAARATHPRAFAESAALVHENALYAAPGNRNAEDRLRRDETDFCELILWRDGEPHPTSGSLSIR